MKVAIKILLKKLNITLNDLDITHLTEYLKKESEQGFNSTEAEKGEIVFRTLNGL